ncbi:MAG: hypothetical protein ACXVLQ_16420 [Bacteriovorax sp.]
MKNLLAFFIFTALSNTAFAHPGGHKLVCQSAKHSGSNQKIEISLSRSNGTGWYAPTIEMSVENKKFKLTTPDDMNNYGTTFHNSPLKVITVTADVPIEKNTNAGYFSVVAIPGSVKAFDTENKPVKWSLKAEKDECNDTNGRATFQGIIHGYLNVDSSDIYIDPQILDCELSYNSGMEC